MGAKTCAARQALHEHVGRRRHRHDGHGLRDRRPRAHPDHVDPVQQLLDGHGAAGRCRSARRSIDSTDISGNYADFAKALGGYGERITDPAEIIPAIKRGVQQTLEGKPVLLEFITQKEIEYSTFRGEGYAP